MKFERVRIFLMAAPVNKASSAQGNQWMRLEEQFQNWLEDYLSGSRDSSLLCGSLKAWFPQVRQPKVRFEILVDGKATARELTSYREIDELIGDGKTPGDLLRAIGPNASLQV